MPIRAQVWTWIAAIVLLAPPMAAGQGRTEHDVVELILRSRAVAFLSGTQRIASRFQDVMSATQQALEELVTPAVAEYVWNIQGYAALIDHAHVLIDATQEHLLVAIGRPEARALAEPLARAEARGVVVTTLCLDECAVECGGCRGTICRSCAAISAMQHWLMLVSDSAEALTGEIGLNNDALAVRTRWSSRLSSSKTSAASRRQRVAGSTSGAARRSSSSATRSRSTCWSGRIVQATGTS